MINHHPVQQGIWFEYDGGRYKDSYDIKLKTGEIIKNCYPNGNSWYLHTRDPVRHGSSIHDTEVAEIRLLPDDEVHEYAPKGRSRIERSIRLFAGHVPPWPEGYPVLESLPPDEDDAMIASMPASPAQPQYKPLYTVKEAGKKSDGNEEIKAAAEAKRQRRQARNLKNKEA